MDEDQEFGQEYGDGGSETTTTSDGDTLYADLYDEPEAEGEAEETPLQTAAEAIEPAPAAEEEYTPPAVNVPLLSVENSELFTPEEAEQLNEMAMSGQFAQAMEIAAHRQRVQSERTMQRMMQAQVLHGNTLASLETECGEWYRQHGATIRQTMATLPPEQSGTETAKFAALIAPALYEVQAGADAVKTFTRMARMAARGVAQPASVPPNVPQGTPQPPPRVAPSGSRTGATPGRKPSVVSDMMELFGADESDVRRALDVSKGRR
jgi:hypothetical protein